MKYGRQLKWFLELKRLGKPVPALEERPELYPDLVWIWQIFIQLSRRREHGFNGPQPIRYSEITNAANEYGLSTYTQRTRFIDRLSILDDVYLECIAERQKSKERRVKEGQK